MCSIWGLLIEDHHGHNHDGQLHNDDKVGCDIETEYDTDSGEEDVVHEEAGEAAGLPALFIN